MNRLRARHGADWECWSTKRVAAVAGDLSEDSFGLSSQAYQELTGNINLIVGSAATVTFDEQLDIALNLNTLGASRLLKLAKDAGDIPFLQISTCYVSGTRSGDIAEEVLPLGHTVATKMNNTKPDFDLDKQMEQMFEACRKLNEAADTPAQRDSWRNQATAEAVPNIDARVEELYRETRREMLIDEGMRLAQLHGYNDTYTFTKCMSEQMLVRDRDNVPLTILRPAIIEGSFFEPVPGWIDGLRMADPLIVAYGRGKLTSFPGRADAVMDIIPVDFVVNSMMAAMAELHTESERIAAEGVTVYQSCSGSKNPFTLGKMIKYIDHAFRRTPMVDGSGKHVRPKPLKLQKTEIFTAQLTAQRDKAQNVSGWLSKGGKLTRRMASAAHAATQLLYFAKIYAPYTHHNACYQDTNTSRLYNNLTEEDKKLYRFDASEIDWHSYIVERHVPGICQYVLGTEGGVAERMLSGVSSETEPAVHESLAGNTIFEVFKRTAERIPDEVAVQIRRDGKWLRYTYSQALAATANLARSFNLHHNISPGDKVVVWSESSPEWALAALGIYRAGAVLVPLDPQLPPNEMLGAAKFTDARLILASPKLFNNCKDIQDAPPIVSLNEPFMPAPDSPAVDSAEKITCPANASSLASILFTSGTTLAPKAVGLTHENFLSNARAISQVLTPYKREQFLSVLPMYHVFEFTGGFVLPLAAGATISYVEELKGPEIVSVMQETKSTTMLLVPRLLELFLNGIRTKVAAAGAITQTLFKAMECISNISGGRLGRKLFGKVQRNFGGHLGLIVCGGSALNPDTFRAFKTMGFSVAEAYGLTETSPGITVTPSGTGKPGSVGKVLPGVNVEIRNKDENGNGEVWVRGPNVMNGYYKNDEATAAIFEDKWMRTGDLAHFDSDGYLFITGRLKELIVTAAGKNVYPEEVELRYGNLPHVKELCVLGMTEENGTSEEVHAVIVREIPDTGMDTESIDTAIHMAANEISEQVPTHQRIVRFHFWADEELPKTSTLKVKRGMVRDKLKTGLSQTANENTTAQQKTTEEETPDCGSNETWLREALASLTKRPARIMTPEKNLLLDLGVDSLMKVELLGMVESTFGIVLADETIGRISRIGDILNLIKDLPSTEGAAKRTWRDRLTQRTADTHSDTTSALLLPLRWTLNSGLAILNSRYNVKVENSNNVPKTGAFILAPNHTSHLDALVLHKALNSKRNFRVVGARDYFCSTWLRRFIFTSVYNLIAVDRHASDMNGLNRCIKHLAKDEGLLVFPEGARQASGMLNDFKPGIGLIAVESKAPIIPVGITGAYHLMPKGKRMPDAGNVTVRFGEPIVAQSIVPDECNEYEAYMHVAEVVHDATKNLLA